MRAYELTEKKNTKQTNAEWHQGWSDLEDLKQMAHRNGERMASNYQLFVPRGQQLPTVQDRSKQMLGNKHAWDDEGNLKKNYQDWDSKFKSKDYHPTGREDQANESAPVLTPGRRESPPGTNKPRAQLWTSTARKDPNGWSSEWSRWIAGRHPDWQSNVGYLYQIQPGALILEIDSTHDAERIMMAFGDIGKGKGFDHNSNYDSDMQMRLNFPWDYVARHFDAVYYAGYYNIDADFTMGWDVESTAWFDTRYLKFISTVRVSDEF